MGSSIFFPLSALPIIIIIIVIFNIKGYIKSSETKLYNSLIWVNLFALIIEILCSFACIYFEKLGVFSWIILKGYLLLLLLWTALFTNYIYTISYDKKNKKMDLFQMIFLIIIFWLIALLPMEIVVENNNQIHYTTGLCCYFAYFVSMIYSVEIIYILLSNSKKVFNKKYIPVFAFFIIGLISIVIQIIRPEILLLTYSETLICLLMFYTIENPDVKMIEQLDMAKLYAEKANAAKTEFLSSMSHEIRTPLNAIVGFSDCILESETLAEAKDNAADIVNASETLLEIVNGILDISKIEAGKIEIINTRYNAPNTYLELAKLIRPKMLEKGLDFSYNIAEDLPNTLLGDHANIKKIITNLLSNACKYTDRGFVHYEVNCVNSGGVCKLIISVEDSGRGIKKESVDKMFTKFQRLDEDKNTTIEGTGLGLAITKQLTELMGGRIIVHTVYGQGSKFTVVINQKIENTDVVETNKYKTTLDLKDVRLLIVDDNVLNLKVAKKMFEKFNANCITTCESGFDCIDKIKNGEEYDIILLDDMMPKKSGVETLLELKELPGFKTPVIALTANAISGMREKYLSDGFDDYLAKPIDKNEFIRVCNEILGRINTEEFEVISPAVDASRDEIIVPEDRSSDIIPVEENIEEILGDKLDIGRDKIIVDEELKSEAEEVELLDDSEIDEVIIPDLEPVVDVDITSSCVSYDRNYLENNGVDVNHALELLGDIEMYNMTINDFISEIDEKWSRINTYKDNKDMENYAIDVHSLKSDCKYLGFMKLADISYQHELKSKENDVEFILNHFGELEDEYYKMYNIAKNYVDNNKSE